MGLDVMDGGLGVDEVEVGGLVVFCVDGMPPVRQTHMGEPFERGRGVTA